MWLNSTADHFPMSTGCREGSDLPDATDAKVFLFLFFFLNVGPSSVVFDAFVQITSLCGRDGRTICGPLRVPKTTYVTLAYNRKPKFFYFGCSLVRRCKCKQSASAHGTDGRTDRVRRNMRPLLGRRAA